MTKARIDHAFIEIGRLGIAVCEPTQQLADQVQASPSTIASAPIIDKTRRVELDKLPVRPTLETPQQPAPTQVLICLHRLHLRCCKRRHRTNYAEPIICRAPRNLGKTKRLGIARCAVPRGINLKTQWRERACLLTDTLTKLGNHWPASRIDDLMPWAHVKVGANPAAPDHAARFQVKFGGELMDPKERPRWPGKANKEREREAGNLYALVMALEDAKSP